jgi:hypothetical protein
MRMQPTLQTENLYEQASSMDSAFDDSTPSGLRARRERTSNH